MRYLLFRVMFLLVVSAQLAAQGIISTIAGNTWIYPGGVNKALDSPIGGVQGLAVDGKGNLFAADPDNHIVFRISRDGVATVAAGNGIEGYSGDTGPATNASLNKPVALAFDTAGNLYIADSDGQRIRKVAVDGTISTVAGNGAYGYEKDGVAATSTSLASPSGVAVDGSGNLYISDTANYRIRKVTPAGIITTFAGTGVRGATGDDGVAVNAALSDPLQIVFDRNGNLYVAQDRRIRKITPGGMISTFAGNDSYSTSGDGGVATKAGFPSPEGLAVDAGGAVYATDRLSHVLRKIGTDGVINTVAGYQVQAYSGDGGAASKAGLSGPRGVAVDAGGTLYIADTLVNRIRRIEGAIITTFAGNGRFKFGGDGGLAVLALLNQPTGTTVDSSGNLLIADTLNHRVRKITPAGVISTIAGNGIRGFSGDGGPGTGASLNEPTGLALDGQSNLYIADNGNHRIRRLTPSGTITTIAGGGDSNQVNGGPATSAALRYPFGVAVNGTDLYICDTGSFLVRRMNLLTGIMFTAAGNGDVANGPVNVLATRTSIGYPYSIAPDGAGNLYLGLEFLSLVRKITPAGTILAFAGGGRLGSDGVLATDADLNGTYGLAVDRSSNVYIGERYRVRKVDSAGIITTVAGSGLGGFTGDGGSALAASINKGEGGIALDAAGRLYIADRLNDRVRMVSNVQPQFQIAPAALAFEGVSGGAPAIEQAVQVNTSLSGLAFTAVSDQNWLSVSPGSGTMPATLLVSADPTHLGPGTYEGTISITAPTQNPLLKVSVVLRVSAAPGPLLAVDPSGIYLSFVQGTGADDVNLRVLNNGSGTLSFQGSVKVSGGGQWLRVAPLSGTITTTQPANLIVTADPKGLPQGTYPAEITISAGQQSKTIPVYMTIGSGAQAMQLSQTGLTLTGVSGVQTIAPQSVSVLNEGLGTMAWTAEASTVPAGGTWLSVAPASGVSGPQASDAPVFQVFANATGLRAGRYSGQIKVSAPGASNSPQFVSVVFNVREAGSPAYPDVRPTGLIFVGAAGGPSPGSQEILISNLGGTATSFQSGRFTQEGRQWFVHQPVQAAVAPDQPVRVVVSPNTTGLAAGLHRGTLTFQFADGTTSAVEILLVLTAPLRTAAARATAAGCAPTQLGIVFTLLGGQFQVSAAWPTPLEVRVVDDCGTFLNDIGDSVAASFTNGDSPVFMAPVGDGRWSGTWRVNSVAPNMRITVTAETADHSLHGTAELTGAVRDNPGVPTITPDGVVNAASFAAGRPLAPGSLITIFGRSLADGPITSSLPLPTQSGNALVALGNLTLPLQFTLDTQVNAIIPYDAPLNVTQQLIIRYRNTLAVPVPITVAAAQPAIFTRTQTGQGQGAITVYRTADFQPVADGANPAHVGDTIIIYCTGLGAVTPAISAGSMAPLGLTNTVNPATVSIGGVDAPVSFAGLTPGFAGLYQVNAVIPSGVTPGAGVVVTVTVAGQTSVPVTINVQ